MKGDCSVMMDGGRRDDDLGDLRLRGDRGDGERQRREAEADQHVHLVVDDELLGEALGDVRRAGVVLDDQLDLLARDRGAVLLHPQLRARLDLLAGAGAAPVIGRMSPILTASCAAAGAAMDASAAAAAAPSTALRVRANEFTGLLLDMRRSSPSFLFVVRTTIRIANRIGLRLQIASRFAA